jgi:2-dehydropantoate 2-reductase
VTAGGELLARQAAKMTTEAGLETQFTTDIKQYEWEKVVRNTSTNPVCALTRKRIKDVMDFELTETLAVELLREGIEVAKAAGVTFDEGFLEQGIQHLKKAGYHKPSMLQDVERGALTEIDWINGKIVEYARAHGLEAPYNFTVTTLVKGLELKSKASGESF